MSEPVTVRGLRLDTIRGSGDAELLAEHAHRLRRIARVLEEQLTREVLPPEQVRSIRASIESERADAALIEKAVNEWEARRWAPYGARS